MLGEILQAHTVQRGPPDGSRDKEGSKRLNNLIEIAQVSRIFKKSISSRYISLTIGFSVVLVKPVDDFGIRRRKKENAEKLKKRAFQCKLCKWGHFNKASEKVKENANECPARWIFEK